MSDALPWCTPRASALRPRQRGPPDNLRGVSATLRISGLGSSVEARFSEPGSQLLLAAATWAWLRCLGTGMAPCAADPLEVRSPGDGRGGEMIPALQTLTQELTRRLITAQVGLLLLLHAGAVSHLVTRESLVFVAPGGAGKTTLARLLGRSYVYLSDETVGIDDIGRIHLYPKPLTLRTPQGGPKPEASPDDLGLARADPTPTMKEVILLTCPLDYAGLPANEGLGTLDAVQLPPETFSLSKLPRPLRTLAALAEKCGPVLSCFYAEADDLVGLTGELIGSGS
jgi:hypothetical protein